MSAPIVVIAVAGAAPLLFKSSTSIVLLTVVPVGMWAKASISPLSELAREAGEAQPVGTADRPQSTGLLGKFAAACDNPGSGAGAPCCKSPARRQYRSWLRRHSHKHGGRRVARRISAPRSLRTGREPLDSSGSRHLTAGPRRQWANRSGARRLSE